MCVPSEYMPPWGEKHESEGDSDREEVEQTQSGK